MRALIRTASLALAFALGAGALAAPALQAPSASAAQVLPAATKVAKPKITSNLPRARVVTAGKTTTLKVQVSGGKITYQWYSLAPSGLSWKKVGGPAGKKAALKVSATLAKAGTQYRVIASNAKGRKTSRVSMLVVRSTIAKPFGNLKPGVTGNWALAVTTDRDTSDPSTTLVMAGIGLGNLTTKTRNPKGNLVVAYRAANGKVFADLNASGDSGMDGTGTIGSIKPGKVKAFFAAVAVPPSLATGGRWVITDKSAPKVALYFAS